MSMRNYHLFKSLTSCMILLLVSTNLYAHPSFYNHHHPQHRPGQPKYSTQHRFKNHRRHAPPAGYKKIWLGSIPFFYRSGVFIQLLDNKYVIVQAPIGAVVNSIPGTYSTILIKGKRYYVLDDETYFVKVPEGYKVVSVPKISEQLSEQQASSDLQQIEIIPTENQKQEKQAKDQYECHRWGVVQSKSDPTDDKAVVSQEQNQSYISARNACLESRGYEVLSK